MENKLIGYLIIGVILGGVFLFNFVIIQKIRKGDPLYDSKKYETYGKFVKSVQNPFANADKDVEKLSEIVRAMEQKEGEESDPD